MIRRSLQALTGLAIALMISCGNRAVELSTPPRLEPSTEPTTIGSINEHVGWLTVDEQRLYWTGGFAGYNDRTGETGIALHSCEKERCAESLVTYDASRVDASVGFGVHEGAIYWTMNLSFDASHRLKVVSCAVTGCEGPPRVLYADIFNTILLGYGPDAVYLYDSVSQAIERMPYSGAAQPQPVAGTVNYPQSLAVHGDYIYVLEPSSTDRTATLRRARIDGSTGFETVAERLKIIGSTDVYEAGRSPIYTNLAFDAAYVYWTSNTLTGSIQRCPLTGCVGGPESLSAAIRAPTGLRVDDEKAYFQYYDLTLGNALTSCSLPHCEPSVPITNGLDDWNVVAIDDRYIYTATTDQTISAELRWDFPSAHVRRFPK